ncbi:MAG: hypothetical protein K2Y01_06295 [Rhabdochlamydiaceae bacterium]|nr:hypothetical protein [Rhabdochlamydiaceae bacterium]
MHGTSAASVSIPICFLCDDPISLNNSKTFGCCQNIIHNTCFERSLRSGSLKCCFCATPITDLSLQTKVQGVMSRAFEKRKREEQDDITIVVRSMYNPGEEDISLQDQMDNFLVQLLEREEPLVYKRRLWAEFVEQINNPASQLQEGWTMPELEEALAFWIVQNIDLVGPFLEEEPFVVSRDILKATAKSLLEDLTLSDAEKKESWDAFFQQHNADRQNREVIDLFILDNGSEFPYLSITENSSSLVAQSEAAPKYKKSRLDPDEKV